MNKEEKEICIGKRSGKTYNKIQEMAKEIVKLEKENEELKEELASKNKQIKLMQEMNLPEEIEINYISKDTIRDKIKELEVKYKKYEKEGLSGFVEKLDIGTRIDVLKELLGESNE